MLKWLLILFGLIILMSGTSTGWAALRTVVATQAPDASASAGEQWTSSFVTPASGRTVEPSPKVKVSYDDRALHIVFSVPIRDKKPPQGQTRVRDGEVWLDDSVEVYLDSGQTKKRYYQFIVNCRGSIYDAKGADAKYNPDWEHTVQIFPQQWTAELTIPYVALEVGKAANDEGGQPMISLEAPSVRKPQPGDTWGVNFCFNTADKAHPGGSWAEVGSSYGNPDRFGRLVFGDGRGEVDPEKTVQVTVRKSCFGGFMDVAVDAQDAAARNPNLKASLVLTDHQGKAIAEPVGLTLKDGKGSLRLGLPATPGQFTLTAAFRAHEKNIVEKKLEIEIPPEPPWARTQVGTPLKVHPPFTPMKIEGTKIACWGRTYDYRDRLLPAQMTVLGKDLLAGPIGLSGQYDGKTIEWSDESGKAGAQEAAVIEWKTQARDRDLTVSCQSHVEFDGCIRQDLVLQAPKGKVIDQLRLVIPLKESYARYIHANNTNQFQTVAGALESLGGNWEHEFWPFLWLGSEDRGLMWFAESDEPFSLRNPNRAIRVQRVKDKVLLIITLIDKPTRLIGPWRWAFGLQATPVKPVDERFPRIGLFAARYGHETKVRHPASPKVTVLDYLKSVGVEILQFHQDWTKYYGYPHPEWPAKLKGLLDGAHRRGMKLIVYFGYGVANASPEMQCYHDEWTVQPLIYWGSSKVPAEWCFDAGCTQSTYPLFELDGMAKLLEKFDLDGLYLDGTTMPFGCTNDLHGCGYLRDGVRHKTYPIWANRRYIQRIWNLLKEKNPRAVLYVHTSGVISIPTLSLADVYLDGEQFKYGGKFGEPRSLPLDKFRAEYMGKPYGLRAEFLFTGGKDDLFDLDGYLALTLLHDVKLAGGSGADFVRIMKVRKLLDDFGTSGGPWLPYWNQTALKTDAPNVYASVYLHADKGPLMVVANLGARAAKVNLVLDAKQLHIQEPLVFAIDAETGRKLPITRDALTVPLGPMKYVMIHIRK